MACHESWPVWYMFMLLCASLADHAQLSTVLQAAQVQALKWTALLFVHVGASRLYSLLNNSNFCLLPANIRKPCP
jgi:hypothetical protein